MSKPDPAVVLLSGGLDSATALAIAIDEGFAPIALSFRYGQRHAVEIDAARPTISKRGVTKHVDNRRARTFAGSDLSRTQIVVCRGATRCSRARRRSVRADCAKYVIMCLT